MRYLILLAALLCGAAQAAESYPSRPGRLILPFGSGGSTDIIGRIFAQRFSETWGQTLVVDNRPGAAGTLGSALAASAAPDGYTIFTYGINQAITPNLVKQLPYDPVRDFMPVSLYATMPNILCINPSLAAASVADFIKLAKSNPGKYRYASSGVGASPHLTMELFKAVTGTDMIHVPYKVSSQAYMETITGQVQTFFFNLPGPLPHIKSGKLRALAVTSARRADQVPQIPTMMESGVQIEVTVWQGYAMPRGTSKAHMTYIHGAMMKALESPELKQRFFDAGVAAAPQAPGGFEKFIRDERAKWQKAVALAGVKPE